jgi:hypothetical protein
MGFGESVTGAADVDARVECVVSAWCVRVECVVSAC